MIPARVLIGDRSMSIRAVLRRLLEASPAIEVVGDSADGLEIVRFAAEKKPTAIVLDLDLPSLAGRALVERIDSQTQTPIFVLTPRQTPGNARVVMGLHRLGVVAVFPKPAVPDEWTALGRTLTEALLQVSSAGVTSRRASSGLGHRPVVGRDLRCVAVGASTGGPGAMYEMLAALGRPNRIGVAVVQHISEGFEGAYAEWLAIELGMDVAVARHGERLGPGQVRIAPHDQHLAVNPDGTLRLDRVAPLVGGHRPAADVLFRSLLGRPRGQVAAVLLSGMGEDGAAAMVELRRANVLTIVQDEASCAVYGMPRAAIERRGASFALPPAEIGHLLARAGGMRP